MFGQNPSQTLSHSHDPSSMLVAGFNLFLRKYTPFFLSRLTISPLPHCAGRDFAPIGPHTNGQGVVRRRGCVAPTRSGAVLGWRGVTREVQARQSRVEKKEKKKGGVVQRVRDSRRVRECVLFEFL